mmetsp:Transcript_4386/g.17806  ORF Transcript_4386/g.17806 Transcript_4386/m.17806 type:complete len:85 (-) Transcript_4386:389-643(-)
MSPRASSAAKGLLGRHLSGHQESASRWRPLSPPPPLQTQVVLLVGDLCSRVSPSSSSSSLVVGVSDRSRRVAACESTASIGVLE